MSTYEIDGRHYHVKEAGSGEPLVLLHGFTGCAANWRGVMERPAGRYRVLAVDLLGHGHSDAPAEIERYAMPNAAADLGSLLQQCDALPAHWLGYSMGGRLALYVAVNHPQWVRSLILESASPGLREAAERAARRQQDEALAERIEAEGIDAFVHNWEAMSLFASQRQLSAETRAALRAGRLANSTRGLANSLRGMGTGAQPSLWERLGEIERPALLIAGELDSKFVSINRQMAGAIPGAALRVVAGAGHTVHLERPDAYVELALGFLASGSEGSHDLAQAEQDDESQRGQRHLLEPGIERGQVGRALDGQAIADEQGHGQQVQELPK